MKYSMERDYDRFVVFDLETTGLSKESDEITEIGAVKIVNGDIKERFSTFVNPGKPLSHEITKLTGITDDMLKDAPTVETVLPQFLEFCGKDSVLVAHNAAFDTGFIREKAEKLGELLDLNLYAFTDEELEEINLYGKHYLKMEEI